jgi:hypothetical protein
MVMR